MSGGGGRHVLILGCGYTGCVLAQRLAFRGTPVIGTTRSDVRASVIRTRGAQPVLWDGDDLSVVRQLEGRVSDVVYSLPPRMERDGSYVDKTAAVLALMAGWGLDRFVYVSSTSVYGDRAGAVTTEATVCTPDSPRGHARLEIERAVLASAVPSIVVRPAGIYGPGRSQLHRLAAGRYRLVAGGGAYTNRIHVADLAALLDRAISRGAAGAIYLGADAEPATQRAVVDHIVATYGFREPVDMPLDEARVRLDKNVLRMIVGSKRLDASATHDALGLRLKYPTFREGLADVWRRDHAKILEAQANCD